MLIGYARVSKADGSQSLDLQRDALQAAGVDAVHVYHDFASGVRDDRPGLDSCVRALRTGDVLVVWSSTASAAPSPTWSTPCRTCRPAAWACGCSPGKARRSTPPPRHLRVRALPRTRDHPRDALPVRRAAGPVARARREGPCPLNLRRRRPCQAFTAAGLQALDWSEQVRHQEASSSRPATREHVLRFPAQLEVVYGLAAGRTLDHRARVRPMAEGKSAGR